MYPSTTPPLAPSLHYRVGIHAGIYIPASDKENEFAAEITSFGHGHCLDELCEKFAGAAVEIAM